ncbi:MAG: PilZ domain-containing protein [Myxococcales bacterium]|nr:PilZ domain-containing protein [Myxococcales bacterium]
MEANQRRYPRAPMSGEVKFYEWNRPFQADAAEISGNGLFLKTGSSLPEGSMLTLRLNIPGLARAFTVLGKVVRTVRGGLLKPAGMGIFFVDIAAGDRRSILDYVSRRTLRTA